MFTELYYRAKFLFGKKEELRVSLYAILGFYPNNLDLYKIALTHKSQRAKVSNPRFKQLNKASLHNERLEFLGDSIIGSIVSELIFHRFHNKGEGFLTNVRSKVVQRESLNKLADQLGVTPLINKSSSVKENAHNITGNALEALVGAIYLDRGYSYCKRFILKKLLQSLGDLDVLVKENVNFKSRLIEWCQKERLTISFQLTDNIKPEDLTHVFATTVVIEGQSIGEGEGSNKKESHQKASENSWSLLQSKPKLMQQLLRLRDKRMQEEEASNTITVPGVQKTDNSIALQAEAKRRRNNKRRKTSSENKATGSTKKIVSNEGRVVEEKKAVQELTTNEVREKRKPAEIKENVENVPPKEIIKKPIIARAVRKNNLTEDIK